MSMSVATVIYFAGQVLGTLMRASVEEYEAAAASPGLIPENRLALEIVAAFRRRVRDELEAPASPPPPPQETTP